MNIFSSDKRKQSGFFQRLKKGLKHTRERLTGGFARLTGLASDRDLLDEAEALLLSSDAGLTATERLLNKLKQELGRKHLNDPEVLYPALREEMLSILTPISRPLELDPTKKPYVIMMVGVNGTGKTTTIGKLAHRFKSAGLQVALAAADTFRAAAIEQLIAWGERNQVPVTWQPHGTDPASVVYTALESAKAKNIDVLIIDTAGRLHTQVTLMEQLKKVLRVIAKLDPEAPHEIMLVLDATTGQNALVQAREFNAVARLTGITLTKLDGTAKGGILFALATELGIPVRFIGVGEQVDDLQVFIAENFVEALLDQSAS